MKTIQQFELAGVQLVLGSGFLWRDLLCYAVGISSGAGLEVALRRWLLAASSASRKVNSDE